MEFVGPVLYVTNVTAGGGATPSTLEILDPLSGILTPVGLTGFGPISGLAYDSASGTMYGVTAGGSPATLVTVNLLTGLATPVAPLLDVAGAPLDRVGSIEFASDGVLYGGMGLNATLNPGWLFSINTTTGVSTFIGPTGLQGITGLTDSDFEPPDTSRFNVTKTFSDGSTDEVDVTLTCNTGLPLEQDFTIAGGDPAGVTFVVTDIAGTVSCEVTESGGPAGYTPIFNGGAGCSWENISPGNYTCSIFNQADDATFTVTKEWIVMGEGGEEVNEEAYVTIYCDAVITNNGPSPEFSLRGNDNGNGLYSISDYLGDGESLVATVDTTTGPATCWADESINQSGVESEDDCFPREIPAGGSSSCMFTNTVFFEGIPTLSQYGLAFLALLMLGVGLVGFRRFA